MSVVTALAALRRAVPTDAVWLNEAPSAIPAFQDQIRLNSPGSFLFSASGGLGFALPAAVGVQLGNPARPVVAVVGDGSMHYAISALWTAAAYRVPITVIVFTNHEYAILKWFGRLEGVAGVPGLDLPGIDICSIATGYGIRARRVADPTELVEAVRAGIQAAEPTLIETEVTTG
jgi:benzoylformate decarboxylase